MTRGGASKQVGGIGKRLDLEPFGQLCAAFSDWRIDPVIRMMEKEKAEGRILGFVRGLKLSAHLIYAVRDVLSATDLKVDWGHILDDQGLACSPECDVIIHRGSRRRWNGHENPVMDFSFVDAANAVGVISCRSYLRSVTRDYRDYCRRVKRYVRRVWLFAECCPPAAVNRLEKTARSAGYANFWYLYTWDGESDLQPNGGGWLDFLQAVQKLGKSVRSRGSRG